MNEGNTSPRYPGIVIQILDYRDGSSIWQGLVRATRALASHGVPEGKIYRFYFDAIASDYEHMLRVCREWVTVH